jgi:hypothetical protein
VHLVTGIADDYCRYLSLAVTCDAM